MNDFVVFILSPYRVNILCLFCLNILSKLLVLTLLKNVLHLNTSPYIA